MIQNDYSSNPVPGRVAVRLRRFPNVYPARVTRKPHKMKRRGQDLSHKGIACGRVFNILDDNPVVLGARGRDLHLVTSRRSHAEEYPDH